MIKSNVTTQTLEAGTPVTLTFSGAYPYYWVNNLSDNTLYASLNDVPVPNADGTYTIPSGTQQRISANISFTDGKACGKISLLGEGSVQVVAALIADCPFKVKRKGGESNLTLTTDKLAFSLSTVFTNFSSRTSLPSVSTFGIATGIAERSVEIVNTCGSADAFILSYGSGSSNGSTFALTESEFVGYSNGAYYCNFSDAIGKTRYICCTNYDKRLKIYVNGKKVTDTELTYSCAPTDSALLLNCWRSQSPIVAKDCVTYDIRIFNKVLSDSEIKNNYAVYKEKYSLT